MSELLYAPPEAEIAVASSAEDEFYVVAPRKFYWLSILTFNVYLIYWFYRNWRQVKRQTSESIWPHARGIFFIFFTHSLFGDVDQKIKSLGKQFIWNPNSIATMVVILTVLSNILDRLSSNNIGSPFTDLVGIGLVPVIPAILQQAQQAINFACEDPHGASNEAFTLANWVWMIFGALIWLLIMVGLYFMFAEPELFME